MTRRALPLLAALALAAVFAAAAIPKILNPAEFALAIYRHQVTPHAWINLLAIYLPWLELATAIALLLPRHRRPAAAMAAALLLVFTAILAHSMMRGLNVSCGCFDLSAEARQVSGLNLARNTLLIALAALAAWRPLTPASPPPASAESPAGSPPP